MGKLSSSDVTGAVNTFLSVFRDAKAEKRAEAKDEDDRKYREFYMKLAADQDGRNAEKSELDLERGQLELDGFRRNADANLAILEETGQTLEELHARGELAEALNAPEMQQLLLQSTRLGIDQTKASIKQSEALTRMYGMQSANYGRLASGGGGERPGEDPIKAAQGQLKMMQDRRDWLFEQVSDEHKNEFGEVDMAMMAQANPALAKVLKEANFRVVELADRINTMQSSSLGLTDLSAVGAGAPEPVPDGAGLSGAERALRDAGVVPRKEQREADITAQKEKEDRRARQVNLGTRTAVVESVNDGTLVATDDPVLIKQAVEYGKRTGKQTVWSGKGDVPSNWIGKSAEDYRKQNERGYPPLPTAGGTELGALGRFGGGGPGGF